MNSTQKNIINIASIDIENIKSLNQSYLEGLGRVLGRELSTSETSNIYLLANSHNQDLTNASLTYFNILNEILNFFDSNRFEGYLGGSYDGLRNALLELDFFEDVKIAETSINATIQIVLLFKENIDYEDVSEIIGTAIHNARSVGILTLKNENSINVLVNASTGEKKEYSFFVGEKKVYDMEVTYYLDFQQRINSYDFDGLIKQEVANTYKASYGYLGKNFVIQDFTSMTRNIGGIGRVSIKLIDGDKNEYVDIDVEIGIDKMLVIGEIKTIQGN